MMRGYEDTVVAAATPAGGALSVVRVSGKDAFAICDKIFRSATGRKVSSQPGYTLMYGDIINETGEVVDDILLSVFRSPKSYTGEDSVEISCHGSGYIVSEIIRLLINAGARAADAGEFTSRACLAGRIDLSQAEAVADIIASHDRATHKIASTQMRGGYSSEFSELRSNLLRLSSLLELELDFSEEDVTFADRSELASLIDTAIIKISGLIFSFSLGNAIKKGTPVAIVGSPNAGKSTLLNALLKDDRAMVSDIPGTTRDIIEERINIDGVDFRFIDTAGIRQSDDILEQMGIERTMKAAGEANIILYLFDISANISANDIITKISALSLQASEQKLFIVLNKCDKSPAQNYAGLISDLERSLSHPVATISAKNGMGVRQLQDSIRSAIDTSQLYSGAAIVSNSRHYDALIRSLEALTRAKEGLDQAIPSDLLSQDVRQAIYDLGTVTGEITTNEIISEIFSKFCIGK